MKTTLGAPSGALGAWNGAQSGTESRMSTLVTPLNGLLIGPTPQVVLRVPHRVPLLHDPQPIHGAHHAIGMNSSAAASAWGLRACGPSRGLGPVLPARPPTGARTPEPTRRSPA